MPTESLNLDKFTGLVRTSDLAEFEEGPPGSLYRAENVCLDLTGKAFVVTGYKAHSAAVTSGPASNLYYSASIATLLFTNTAGDIYRCDPTTGALVLVQAAAFTAGARVSWADWPLSNLVYGSDGTNYVEINSSFVYASRTGVAPLGAGTIIHQHKDTMFSVRPPGGSTAVQIVPSTVGDPLAFSTADRFNCQDGGDRITGLSTLNGVLRVHKPYTIWNVFGNTFAGTGKDIQKINTNTGIGAHFANSLCVDGTWEYAICHDGFYRFNESGFEKLTEGIIGKLKDRWYGVPQSGWVSVYRPRWGGDAGRTYIIFSFKDSELIAQHLYKYDTLTGQITEETGYPEVINNFTYSADQLRTFLGGTKIYVFDNVPNRDATSIRGNLVTNVIDYGHKGIMKSVEYLHNLITDYNGVSVYAGVDGLYPTFSLNDYIDSNNTVVEVPEKVLGGVLNQFRWEKTGGGQPLTNGALLQFNPYGPRQGRSFSRSRADAVQAMMEVAPLIRSGSTTTVNGQTTYTITHGLGETPEAALACHAGINYTSVTLVTAFDRTTMTVVLPSNPGDSKTIYWAVIAPGKRLFDSYCRGVVSKTLGTTVKQVNHNLDSTFDAVLLSKTTNAALGLVISAGNPRQFTVAPEATSVDSHLAAMIFKNGTVDNYFRAGTSTSSPITHGLPTTPTAAIIYPNHAPLSNHGITAISATQVTYTGTGSFNWVVFK